MSVESPDELFPDQFVDPYSMSRFREYPKDEEIVSAL